MLFNYVYGENVERKYANVSLSIERITPSVASEMLVSNTRNRDIKRNRPVKLALINDEWILNGATIVFAEDGTLLDGQHRLTYCVETGKPFDTIVVRGVPKRSQIATDTGIKRGVQDNLKILGYTDVNCLAAVGKGIQRAETFGITSAFNLGNSDFTVKSSVDFIVDNIDRIEAVKTRSRNFVAKYKGVTLATIGSIIDNLLQNGVTDEDLDYFLDQVLDREPPSKTVMLLKNRLNQNANSNMGRLPQIVIAAFIVKTWNAYINGTEIKSLHFRIGGARPEEFPEIAYGYND